MENPLKQLFQIAEMVTGLKAEEIIDASLDESKQSELFRKISENARRDRDQFGAAAIEDLKR